MDLEIRPKRGRHGKPLRLLAVVLGLFVVCGAGKVVDRASLDELRVRPVSLTVLILMGIVPFALLVVVSMLNTRNLALRNQNGRLISTDWTGRVVTVEHPKAARIYPIGSTQGFLGNLMIIGGEPGDSAVVVAPSWWLEEDLQSLLHSLHLRAHQEQQITFAQLTQRYRNTRLPISVRRPWLFSGLTTLFVIAYLGWMIHLLLLF
jgi:hypothetical protein